MTLGRVFSTLAFSFFVVAVMAAPGDEVGDTPYVKFPNVGCTEVVDSCPTMVKDWTCWYVCL